MGGGWGMHTLHIPLAQRPVSVLVFIFNVLAFPPFPLPLELGFKMLVFHCTVIFSVSDLRCMKSIQCTKPTAATQHVMTFFD